MNQVTVLVKETNANLKKNKINWPAYILIIAALGFGFFSRLVSVFTYTTFDIGGSPDQVRDAFVYMNMWQGDWPILGPESSKGEGYYLPPLYYYLVFPFTILGANPVFQALPNALFSFLSIPLFIYLVYQLLDKTEPSKRLFLSSLAGFWYSLLFVDIFLSTFHWNPSPIPFFLMFFTLLYKYQLEAKISDYLQLLSWFTYGVVLAILVSLHSTTLFVMPVVFVASCIFYIYKNFRNLKKNLYPVFSTLVANAALLPYWRGEISRDFLNSKRIILTVINSDQEASNYSLWEKIGRGVFNYLELGRQAYFIGGSSFHTFISFIFLAFVLIICLIKFRGNKTIFLFLLFTWSIYLYAASNYSGPYLTFYKNVILFAPIIFTILTLASFNISDRKDKILAFSLAILIGFSCFSNLIHNSQYSSTKYGFLKMISTDDMIQLISQLPEKSTICDPRYKGWREKYHPYKYLDKYITKRKLNLVSVCQSGNYHIYPKVAFQFDPSGDNLAPVFTIYKTQAFEQKSSLFLETPVAYVYRIN
jgi:hypothetical protein